MASPGANEGLVRPSIATEAGKRPQAGVESSPVMDTVGAMEMAVALESDARQAAAVKLADQGRTEAEQEVNIPTAPLAPAPQGRRRATSSAAPSGEVAKLFVGVGRAAGIRPADLVGAIANEAGISSRSIGAIDIADRFSLVEVPASQIDEIIRKLRDSTIRGKKVNVRREEPARRRP